MNATSIGSVASTVRSLPPGARPSEVWRGAAFTLLLAEGLRLAFGNRYPALDTTIYGVMLVLFIIYMPKGILGAALDAWRRWHKPVPST